MLSQNIVFTVATQCTTGESTSEKVDAICESDYLITIYDN